MTTDIPKFKYHPDPISTGVIVESGDECECCGEYNGYVYKASFYCANEIENICPQCIHDGSAAQKFGGMFCDDYPLISSGVDQFIIDEVTKRTPGYETWQQELWLTHCNDACAYLGDASVDDVKNLANGVGFIVDGPDWTPTDFLELAKYYQPKGSPALYKFKCLHCDQILYGMDAC